MKLWRLLLALFIAAYPLVSHSASIFKPSKASIYVNEELKGEFQVYADEKGELYLAQKTFIDLAIPIYVFKNKVTYYGKVQLKSLAPDLTCEYAQAPASLKISVDKSLFLPKKMESAAVKKLDPIWLEGKDTAFLNYSVDYFDTTVNDDPRVVMSHEFVASNDSLTLQSKGKLIVDDGEQQWTRQLTNLTYDDRESMVRYTIGDFSINGGQLGGGASLGGIKFSSAFFTKPSFVSYNVPTISGVMDRPGKVEIYANGSLISSMSNVTGSFEYSELSNLTGDADLKIVKIYPDGTREELTSDAYISRRLLKIGLSDFSYGFGWARNDFSGYDFSYDEPRFVMSHRYGATDWLTAGIFANIHEMGSTRGFILQTVAGGNGEISMQGGRSDYKVEDAGHRGWAAIVSYLYNQIYGSLGLEVTRQSDDFSTGTIEPDPEGGFTRTRFNFSRKLGKLAYLTTRYEYWNYESLEDQKILFTSLTSRFFKKITTVLNWQYSFTEKESRVAVNLSFPLGGEVNASVETDSDTSGTASQAVSLEQNRSGDLGFYYDANLMRSENDRISSEARYRSFLDAGYSFENMEINGMLSINSQSLDNYNLGLSGSIGVIDGNAFMSRQIKDSAILTQTGDLDGVPVGLAGRIQGYSSGGYGIIPNIPSYILQTVTANLNGLPVEYKSDKNEIPVLVEYRKGCVLDLEIKKTSALEAIITYLVDGNRIPAKLAAVELTADGKEKINSFTGADGLLYLENIHPGDWTMYIRDDNNYCELAIEVPQSGEVLINLGELSCVPKTIAKEDISAPK